MKMKMGLVLVMVIAMGYWLGVESNEVVEIIEVLSDDAGGAQQQVEVEVAAGNYGDQYLKMNSPRKIMKNINNDNNNNNNNNLKACANPRPCSFLARCPTGCTCAPQALGIGICM